jgi:thioester reductase-like protein
MRPAVRSGATRVSLFDPLRAHAERDPDRLLHGFLDGDGRVRVSRSYGQALQRSEEIAAHLHRELHLPPGERVLLLFSHGVEMVAGFLACARLGLIPVPVPPAAGHGFAAALHRMNHVARDCRASAVLTERICAWGMRIHRLRHGLPRLSLGRDATTRLPWILVDDAAPGPIGNVPEAHSEVLFLQYTSGSTTEPRGVMVTHANVLENARITIPPSPVGVSWLPQYHDMGLIGAYLFPAVQGGSTWGFSPLHFLERPWLWLRVMAREGATLSAAPNFAYAYCARPDKVTEEHLEGIDLASVEVLMSGAEPVRADVMDGFARRFAPYGLRPPALVASYGLAEYTLAATAGGRRVVHLDAARLGRGEVEVVAVRDGWGASGEDGARSREAPLPAVCATAVCAPLSQPVVSCGRPLASTRVRIVLDGEVPREAPPGRVGEVWLAGPSRARGYWGRPEESRAVFEARLPDDDPVDSGWLRTGDLGFLLEGELYLCGRAKDVIIVRGANWFPQDIEAAVEEDPRIRKGCVAAFAVEGEGSDRLVVVAELRNRRRRPDAASLQRRVRERLGLGVDTFVLLPARTIPKTSSGKLMRSRTRELWRAGGLPELARMEVGHAEAGGPGGAEGTRHPLVHLEDLRHRYRLGGVGDATLWEAGLDSVDMALFASDLEEVLRAHGAEELAGEVDLRWLQRIPVSELFALLEDLSTAGVAARARFRRALARLEGDQADEERAIMRRDARLAFCPGARPWAPGPSTPGTITSGPRAPGRLAPGRGGILLTGGTGFLGPFLLQALLEQGEEDIHVLLRADDPAHGRERIRAGLASLGLPLDEGALAGWEDRVHPVPGDLSLPRMGLTDRAWRRLAERVHTIWHNGALVNYLGDYQRLRATNVVGTNEVLRLAFSGRWKVMNHVSSTFVFGWSTRAVLHEAARNRGMELLDFGYSQTKWVSEQLVFDAMGHGLDARVFRPALITPSVRGGGYNFDVAIRILAFMIHHGLTTTAQNQVSFSPADQVAANMVAIAGLPDTVGGTFHVTRDAYASLLDVTDLLGAILGRTFEPHSLDRFVPLVIERCKEGDLLFPLLNFLVRSVDLITGMEFKRYDNRHYREARDRAPFARPDPPLEEVVLGIVRFLRRHGVIEEATHVGG